ncbi:2-oxoacid:acceptor oxidoreductase family protein [Sporomusa sphaeroides]|uniref:Pyruvate synthase subunit PorC n=2 Tax=Sporomusa TaxID=2375 RepID=A0ABP2C9D6_9FIRM|nr:2-oxoacid:acceptor oxidoreductase family protein [Sporomusa sphaeroides]OLS57766.1 pyruvate synthase subunit PorC [Sporomusa sphaeroides DSM 2875]CVK20537.1 Pyruvate synthase subunit PorC [Sporomusa sphaeroides DSM 2875]SCM80863.1 Pyruvate ferredoxin/flavodoxin oxidoreductase [uncultured Sporomusa sp.]
MMDKILLAGFGGQGVMFIGKVLAYSGMLGGREVCWIPSYGPEMRGGTANCSVLVSDEEIHSPVINQADAGIVLNQPSYDKFLARVKPGGTLVVNSSIIDTTQKRDDINIVAVPATELANEIGNASLANMVCLGALLPALSLVDLDSVKTAMDEVIGKKKPELYELNVAAIRKGLQK